MKNKPKDLRDDPDRLPDCRALLTFIASEKGGRRSPVTSGFSALFDFVNEKRTPVLQTFDDESPVYPGDTVPAALTLLDAVPPGTLYGGRSFDFYEGEKKIGTGIITALT